MAPYDNLGRDELGWWGRNARLQSQIARMGVEAAEDDARSSAYVRQRMALAQARRAGAQASVGRGSNLLAQRRGIQTAAATGQEGVAQAAGLRSQEVAAAQQHRQQVMGQQVAGHLAYQGLEQDQEQFRKQWEQARENEQWRQSQREKDDVVQAYGVAAQAAGMMAGGFSDEGLKDFVDEEQPATTAASAPTPTQQPSAPPPTVTPQPQETSVPPDAEAAAARASQQRELELQTQKAAQAADARATQAIQERQAAKQKTAQAESLQSLTARALAQNQDPNRGWKALSSGLGGAMSGIGGAAGGAVSDEKKKNVDALDAEGETTLRSLDPKRWRYKESAQRELGLTDREQVSPTAQDLERTPWGKLVVYDTPDGKQVDTAGATLQQYALLSSLQHQIDQLRGGRRAARA